MTSIPASRRARAMIFAPRSCPSRPGLATTTRIFRVWVVLTAAPEDMPPAFSLDFRRSALDDRGDRPGDGESREGGQRGAERQAKREEGHAQALGSGRAFLSAGGGRSTQVRAIWHVVA